MLNSPSTNPGTFASFIKANDPLGLFTPSDCDALGNVIEDTPLLLTSPPLELLPCVNCLNPAKLPCAKCKLVSYCSQKCEKLQRNVHKRYCGVVPAVAADESGNGELCSSKSPAPLHGVAIATTAPQAKNLPAVDVINIRNNEMDKTRDFSLAFVASEDLRNVVHTVNALGSDYTGRLHILLNGTSKANVSRNIVLLLILGAMPNEVVAADIALHFWYSAFLPEEYRLRILTLLVLVLQQYIDKTEPLSVDLGLRTKLTCLVPREITDQLLYTAGPTLSPSQARDEYERVNATLGRLDVENGALAGLKPCHKLAFMAFWRSRVVLPFSIKSDRYSAPNASFFSSCGTWLPNNIENPLASWDPNEVVKTGQAHGAQPEDIFGCLYFYLSDQLRTFARRIRELDVTFLVFNTSPHTLARGILRGHYSQYGLTPSVRFNRVDLAHTLADPKYMRDVLNTWAPLLAEGDTAAIIGVFSDWTDSQKDGSVVGSDDAVVAPIFGKLIKLGRMPPGATLASAMATETAQLDAAYDNSKAFSRFLKNMSFGEVLRETKRLKRRLRHKILPQRIKMPVDAKSSDLPHLPEDETWYRYVRLAKVPFTARYVELARTTV